MSEWQRFAPSRPRRAEGGIKARTKRGSIGQQWWSRRFIDVLESFGMRSRLARGRSYARAGQILELKIARGAVTAQVQGSRARPYRVRIDVPALTEDQWRRVEGELAGQALFRAKLLAGEMPPEIEGLFDDCGLPLFPATRRDLAMSCSCPDWEVPCKHLAATCYLLAEKFDDDPFLVLAWRGREREDLLARLRQLAAGAREEAAAANVLDVSDPPLADCLDDYWEPRMSLLRLRARPTTAPSAPDLLLRTLEPPPVKIRRRDLVEVLRPAYVSMAAPTPGGQDPLDP
jgi:uncharacterized Zn finger protein